MKQLKSISRQNEGRWKTKDRNKKSTREIGAGKILDLAIVIVRDFPLASLVRECEHTGCDLFNKIQKKSYTPLRWCQHEWEAGPGGASSSC